MAKPSKIKIKIKYVANFSNGTYFETETTRPTGFAWRVEFIGGARKYVGGFSATEINATKARDSWIARLRKQGAKITFYEVAPTEII